MISEVFLFVKAQRIHLPICSVALERDGTSSAVSFRVGSNFFAVSTKHDAFSRIDLVSGIRAGILDQIPALVFVQPLDNLGALRFC